MKACVTLMALCLALWCSGCAGSYDNINVDVPATDLGDPSSTRAGTVAAIGPWQTGVAIPRTMSVIVMDPTDAANKRVLTKIEGWGTPLIVDGAGTKIVNTVVDRAMWPLTIFGVAHETRKIYESGNVHSGTLYQSGGGDINQVRNTGAGSASVANTIQAETAAP